MGSDVIMDPILQSVEKSSGIIDCEMGSTYMSARNVTKSWWIPADVLIVCSLLSYNLINDHLLCM